jgi:hypothetical protein
MRDYGAVSPRFWIGETGKLLRGRPEAQVLALYLMTSPHSTMTGVFHCPVLYMAHETGLGMEGTTKALQRLSEVGFCEYEEASETIFVARMAAYQVGESLKPSDNRIVGLKRDVEKMGSTPMRKRFLEVYGEAFHLVEKASPHQAPKKPPRSQEQEQEQEQEDKAPRASPPSLTVSDLRAEGVSEEAATGFIAIRRRKRAPLTALAWRGFKREAVKAGWGLDAAVSKAVERGWQSFDADWVKAERPAGENQFAGAL